MNQTSGSLNSIQVQKREFDRNYRPIRIFRTISLIAFFLLLFLSAFILLSRFKKKVLEDSARQAQSNLISTHQAVRHIWLERYFDYTAEWASEPILIKSTRKVLQLPLEKKALMESPAQEALRSFFRNRLKQYDALGLIVISADFKNVGSMYDENLADDNLIGTAYPERLAKVFEGETQVIPPMPSDIPLSDHSGALVSGYPTMFVAGPIRDEAGKIIAAMAIRLNPVEDFSEIAQTGNFGKTGETYYVNEYGTMVSETRFVNKLHETGMLEKGQLSMLNIEVRDPGGNLFEGYQPQLSEETWPLTYSAARVISKETGYSARPYRDYRGINVIGSWLWDEEIGLGFITEINEREALQPYRNTFAISMGLLGISSLLTIIVLLSSWIIERRSNRQIQRSMHRFKVLFESTTEANVILDDRGISDANQAAINMLGVASLEDLRGKRLDDFAAMKQPSGESSAELLAHKLEEANAKEQTSFDFQFRKMNSEEEFPVEISFSRVEIGEKQAVLAVWHDLSERKQNEDRLRESEEKSRLLLESASDGIIGVDQTGRASFVNTSALEILGYQEKEILGRPIHSMIHHSYLDGTDYHLEDCPMSHAYTLGEISKSDREVLWRKDGNYFHAEYTATPLKKNGELLGAVIMFRDITEKKEAEAKLQESQQNIQHVIESAPVGLAIVDLENARPMLVNRAICEILGLNDKEALELDTRKIYANPEDRIRILQLVKAQGRIDNMEIVIRKPKSGDRFWAVVSIIPVDYYDKPVFITSIIDVTRMKELQIEIEKAKDIAEAATQAKSEFLARMSHEIRTPMNAVIGLTHLTLQTDLDRKQRENLKKVHSSGISLLGIINDILDFSKIEAGKLELEHSEFDLERVFHDLANIITYKAHEKGLELAISLPRSVPHILVGDPLRLNQILINLANNAIKFTHEGEIIIHAEQAEQKKDRIKLKFSVKDTGIGLTKEQMNRLFKSFSQADISTTRKYGGTGLGLSISKSLAELMGGEIWVESEKGRGSTFHFTAWFGLGKEQKENKFMPSMDLRGMKVLVCDDNETSRQILTEALEAFSFKVTSVSSAREAISSLEENQDDPYKLVLMDWNMPEIDGIQAAEKIKTDRLIGNNPVIIMVTAYNREEVLTGAEQAGLDATLIKPFSYSTLFDTIMEAFGKELGSDFHGKVRSISDEVISKIRGSVVLLVEDNEVNQDVAVGILEGAGVHAEIAENGKMAMEMVKQSGLPSKYQMVLMDLQMPEMDGYTATRQIRKIKEYQDLPIAAMTADAIAGVKEKCLEVGMNDFITKPVNPDELYATLSRWIKGTGSGGAAKSEESIDPESEEYHASKDILIPEVEGLDIADGLRRVNNNRELFVKLLGKFASNYATFLPEFRQSLKDGRSEETERMMHTLKGVAGNIGAREIHQYAAGLNDKLKSGKPVDDEEIEKLDGMLSVLLDGLRAVTKMIEGVEGPVEQGSSPGGGSTGEACDADQLKDLLKKLISLLNESDSEASDKIEEIRNHIGAGKHSSVVNRIKELISAYEFDEAAKDANQLMEKITRGS